MGVPAISAVIDAPLAKVSVVMIESAASANAVGERVSAKAGSNPKMVLMFGICGPIAPVAAV